MTRYLPLVLLLAACGADKSSDTGFADSDTADSGTTDGALADYLVVDITGTVVIGTHSTPSFGGGCESYTIVDTQPYTTYYRVTDGGWCDVATVGDDYYVEVHVAADEGAYHFTVGEYAYEIDPRYGADWAGMFYSPAYDE